MIERQRAEQAIGDKATRLTEGDRAKDEFLAKLAHELRNHSRREQFHRADEALGGHGNRPRRVLVVMVRSNHCAGAVPDPCFTVSRLIRTTQ